MSLRPMSGFPGGSVVKNASANAGEVGSIPGLGRKWQPFPSQGNDNPTSLLPPGEGNGNLLQYSCLGNPMDRGAWQATVQIAKESDMASD